MSADHFPALVQQAYDALPAARPRWASPFEAYTYVVEAVNEHWDVARYGLFPVPWPESGQQVLLDRLVHVALTCRRAAEEAYGERDIDGLLVVDRQLLGILFTPEPPVTSPRDAHGRMLARLPHLLETAGWPDRRSPVGHLLTLVALAQRAAQDLHLCPRNDSDKEASDAAQPRD